MALGDHGSTWIEDGIDISRVNALIAGQIKQLMIGIYLSLIALECVVT